MNNPPLNAIEEIADPMQKATARAIQAKFVSLGFIAIFSHVESGPVITQYFFKPLPTSPLNKIMSKTEDIALSVGASVVSLQRVMDKLVVTIPNSERQIIRFDDCLWQSGQIAYKNGYKLPLILGKNSTGTPLCIDLLDQPHLLIAGSTGSGKSVFLSELICGLSVLTEPTDVRMILVDTKRLDLTLFDKLKHVELTIDDVKDLYDVFEMLLSEVRRRTKMMQGLARNLKEFNAMGIQRLPYYVLIIDELADIISQDKEIAKNEDKDFKRTRISASLAALAQISRAAGIHIIAATQRPSVKIINGDIKANFPTRVCFKLPSSADSRVVLDENGAETLLGKGDYFYKSAIDSDLQRAHSAFVSIDDICRINQDNENIRKTLASSLSF